MKTIPAFICAAIRPAQLALLVAGLWASTKSIAAPGDVDLSFGGGTGRVMTDFGVNDSGRSVALQADGKIIVAGYTAWGDAADFALARYSTDGSLDSSFNGSGKIITNMGGNGHSRDYDYAHCVSVQTDGKIVVAGSWSSYSAFTQNPPIFALVRYNSDGTTDSTFSPEGGDTGGRVTIDAGSGVTGMALLDDGKIVVAGTNPEPGSTLGRLSFARVRSDGRLDQGFRRGNIECGYHCVATSVVLQDGKILSAGYAEIGATTNFAVVRLHSDGFLDTSFGGTGTVFTAIGDGAAVGNAAAVQGDGKIVVAGAAAENGTRKIALVRYNTDGSLDTSFNGTGKVTTAVGTGGAAYSVAVQSNGKIVVAGSVHIGTNEDFLLMRYNADGSQDTRFHGDGIVTADFGGGDDTAYGLAIQSDGKVVVAGQATNDGKTDFALIRYRADPDPEIDVEQPAGVPLTDGTPAPLNYGPVAAGRSASLTFTIRNSRGTADLTGLAVTKGTGGNPEDFTIGPLEATTLAPDASTTFTVTFSPTAAGVRTATLQIASNDADENPFNIALAATGLNNAPTITDIANQTINENTNTGALAFAVGDVETAPAALTLSGSSSNIALVPHSNIVFGGAGASRTVTVTPLSNQSGMATITVAVSDGIATTTDTFLVTVNAPEIAVEQPPGTNLMDGAAEMNYDRVVAGSGSSKLFTIRNTGTANLTGLAVTLAAGDPTNFIVGALGATTLAPGVATTFTVTFSPTGAGVRTAKLQIASNDVDENPFEINLTGSESTPSEAWRLNYFGALDNTGAGADLSDPDRDGIVNLIEYATGSNPLKSTLPSWQLVKNGNNLEFTCTRRKVALDEMTFELEASVFDSTWHTLPSASVTILSDDGVMQQVKYTTPAGTAGKRFVRLRVTRL